LKILRPPFTRKKIVLTVSILLAAAIVLNVGYYLLFPDVAKLRKINPKKTSFMEYREQEWERQGKKKKIRYAWTPLSQISPYVIKAVLIAEDDKFWRHEGFDFEAMKKALEKDIKKGSFKAGGSTVTQQLAKNLYLTPSRNPVRKIKEAVLAWRIEHSLSKRRIIELYLNVAEWGEGIFGIGVAAHHYFGKPASALDAREAARLATVLPNPRRLNPTGTSSYVENRAERIYQIMVRRGIVIEDYEDVMSEPQEETEEETPEPSAADQKTEAPKKPETKDQKDTPQPTAPAEKPTTKTEDGKTGK
jgi:monofunctional biosynthetic peptidoglycan transglycosylase